MPPCEHCKHFDTTCTHPWMLNDDVEDCDDYVRSRFQFRDYTNDD